MTDFARVLWIGGVPGSGKSTVARRLAHRYGLRRYNPDTRTWEHLDRALALGIPAAGRFAAMTPEQRRAATPEQTSYDRAPMILDDLRSLPLAPLVVAEGTPPAEAAASAQQAVSLVISEAEQLARLERRHPGGVPPRYVRMWHEARSSLEGAGTVVVGGDGATMEETLAAVEDHFASRLAAGPRAAGLPERRRLLREANHEALEQTRGWLRHTPTGDPAAAVVACECECGDPECVEQVTMHLLEAQAAVSDDADLLVNAHRR